MATTTQINNFINTIGPIIQKYAKEKGYKVASPIIAQACIESAYGTSSLGYKYHNYFGMKCGSSWKGKSVNLSTKEEYTAGTLTNIKANFRAYNTMEDGVIGYFDFINTSRYSNLKSATTAQQYLEYIKSDGYATSSTYVSSNMNVVNKYNLTKFDDFSNVTITVTESNTSSNSNTTTGIYFSKYTGSSGSLDTILKEINVPTSMRGNVTKRRNLAYINGITNYTGNYTQNTKLIGLAKNGTLKRYNYTVTATKLNVRENSNSNTSTKILTTINNGTKVGISKVEHNWGYAIELGGWISLSYAKKI